MEDLDALLEELERSSLGESNEDPEPVLQPSKDGKMAETAKAQPAPDDKQPMPAQLIYTTKIEEANVYSDIQEPEARLQPQATSAAAQLDELMAHLCQMQAKVMAKSDGSKEPVPKKKDSSASLDTMLGGLQQDLQDLGIATIPKGHCASCQKPIAGKVITALGKTWHPEHFVCTHCKKEIGCSSPFFERSGFAYCSKDYHQLFSPRCAYCAAPILDKVLTAMDQTWHPEHFFCFHCGEVFSEEGFHEKDKKPYCRKDFLAMFAPRCGGCNRPVLENYLSAMDAVWHPECFVCGDCFQPFSTASFFELNGQPFCELHYHQRRGTICHGCEQPITGRCISAMGHKFHPEHFVCAFCLTQLSKGIFREQNDKAYCQPCFTRLFPL
ncbi:leupaxin isoform X2 [Trichosurus vulpecula]|uniref:leupaxin isoform X2 n=1 Tax=Trichosurus vulpecula TaxID=9337 RepID=UPI00186AE930|nr:leupaxin isoform X2 [Trichosurus vulpecula]